MVYEFSPEIAYSRPRATKKNKERQLMRTMIMTHDVFKKKNDSGKIS